MSVPSPFSIKCLHPKRIENPYTHQLMVVPCLHCRACQLNKANRYSFLCDLESSLVKYSVFITLTYANKYVPRARMVSTLDDPVSVSLVSVDDGEILCTDAVPESMQQQLRDKCYLFGDIPFLRKSDLQKFFKRLRYYASKYTKEKIRYFAVGEYGPVHFRPHYHILLFFDDPAFLQVCSDCVLQAWPFGRTDCQISKGSASSYVAGYVNSFGTLPRLFTFPSVCPFVVHSAKLGCRICEGSRKEAYEGTVDGFIKKSLVVDGSYREFSMWRSYYAYFFPKCKGYANLSTSGRVDVYRVYDKARKAFPEAEAAIDLARKIAALIYYFGASPASFTADDEDSAWLCQYFYDKEACSSKSIYDDAVSRWITRIYSELLLSKHFLNFVCNGDWTMYTVRKYVGIIDEFYKRLDYLHLTDFFRSQNLFYDSDLYGADDLMFDKECNQFYPYFYDNVNISMDGWFRSSAYKVMTAEVDKYFRDRIKHKELNDKNGIFLY